MPPHHLPLSDIRSASDNFSSEFGVLAPREHEVMRLVVAGYSNKSIGKRLCISPRTVEAHRGRVMKKTGAQSVATLVRMAVASAADDTTSHRNTPVDFSPQIDSLTMREREVMTFVVAGHSNKSIGKELSISSRTVEVHRGRVMRKMGAASLPALVRISMTAAYLEIHQPSWLERRDGIGERLVVSFSP